MPTSANCSETGVKFARTYASALLLCQFCNRLYLERGSSPPFGWRRGGHLFGHRNLTAAPELTAACETVFAMVRNSWPTGRNAIGIAWDCIAWPGRPG